MFVVYRLADANYSCRNEMPEFGCIDADDIQAASDNIKKIKRPRPRTFEHIGINPDRGATPAHSGYLGIGRGATFSPIGQVVPRKYCRLSRILFTSQLLRGKLQFERV